MSRKASIFLLDNSKTAIACKLAPQASLPQNQHHRVSSSDTDILMRLAAFERVRLLSKMHDHLTQKELRSGFEFNNQRVPLVNP